MDKFFGKSGVSGRARWGQIKEKMNIPSANTNLRAPEIEFSGNIKQPEIEFRKMVLRMTKKSETDLELMEKRLKSRRKSVTKPKTEAELMKERLRHIEFSDEEKGFLTKEQMNIVSQKVGDAKKELVELEREGKQNGKLLKDYIGKYRDWEEELKYLTDNGVPIDLNALLQARKRIVIRDLFYDPEEAERRRKAQEEEMRLQREREAEIKRKKALAEEERLNLLESEKDRLRREQEEKNRLLKEEEAARARAMEEEDANLKRYAEDMKRKYSMSLDQKKMAEEDAAKKRIGLLKKFATDNDFDSNLNDVGKLNIPAPEEKQKQRRRSTVRKLDNPFENAQQNKPRSRRASKVGKLNTPFDTPVESTSAAPAKPAWSRGNSKSNSRRNSPGSQPQFVINEEENIFAQEVGAALAGLQELTAKAYGDDSE